MFQSWSTRHRGHRLFFFALQAGFLLSAPLLALDPHKAITQYMQTSWNTESGLPQNSVHAIAQTSNGFLWLATEEGLTRFDGVEFTTYNQANTPQLPSNYVQSLAAGRDGTLWIGTDSGLAEFKASNRAGGTFLAIPTVQGHALSTINALLEDSDGVLWIGTPKGLFHLAAGSLPPPPIPAALATAEISVLRPGAGKSIWVGTRKGLYRVQQDRITPFTTSEGMPSDDISCLAIAPDGSVWVGTLAGGLFQIREGHILAPHIHLPFRDIQSLLVDRDGSVWFALDRHGIGRLHGEQLDLYDRAQGMPTDRCTRAMFEDREGSLWIGLLDAGLLQLRDGKVVVFGKPEGLSDSYVGNLLQAQDGSMWIGADSNGLNHLLPNGKVEVWNHRNGLPAKAIFSLFQSRDSSLWVGYRDGSLARIRNRQVSVYSDPKAKNTSINAIFEDRDGTLWLGFWGEGLTRFHDGTFEHIGGKDRVSQIVQSADGALWLSTDGQGLQRYFHGTTTRFDVAHGLPSDHVLCVLLASDGAVWAGTSSGLSRLRDGHVDTWSLKEGLLEPTVGSLIADNSDNLWLGGDSGLYRIAREELNRPPSAGSLHPSQYGTADGLRSREILYGSSPCVWKARDGRLWFATIRGAAVVDPAHLPVNTIPPPTWIDRVTFDAHVVPMLDGLRLGPGSGNLQVAFTAASFVAPQHVNFRYRLIGFDPDWIYSGARRGAWYTNLPAGNYSFVVQAQNSDGLWNTQGDSFQFTLVPPITRTPLAYACYTLLAVLLGWGILALRTRSLVQRQEELTRLVAVRTEQLEAEKTALEAARRELHIQATHDTLTGIFNRGAILEHLQREISRAVRDNTPLGVVVADIDHFKSVNDSNGHLCGDHAIAQFAQRFQAALRAYDVIGRIGGEEFLLLFPGWDLSVAPERIQELLGIISDRVFKTPERELHLTCSMGVATFDPGTDVPDPLEVLKRADVALYAAKHSGRNRAHFESRPTGKPAPLIR